MGKLIVMDYSDGSINVYDKDKADIREDSDDFLDKLGHNVDECYYMLCNELKINRFDLKEKQDDKR